MLLLLSRLRQLHGHVKFAPVDQKQVFILRMHVCLEKATQLLDAEEREDGEMRSKYGAQWTPTRSQELNSKTRAEGAKFEGFLKQATAGDGTIKEKFDANLAGMAVLCKDPTELSTVC